MPSSGVKTCARSEEHTSELQSHDNLVCRLLLEKKKKHTQLADASRALCYMPSRCDTTARGQSWRAARARGRGPSSARPGASRCLFFFFNDPAPPEIYPLPLHAALPIWRSRRSRSRRSDRAAYLWPPPRSAPGVERDRKSTRLNSSHTIISYAVFCL